MLSILCVFPACLPRLHVQLKVQAKEKLSDVANEESGLFAPLEQVLINTFSKSIIGDFFF